MSEEFSTAGVADVEAERPVSLVLDLVGIGRGQMIQHLGQLPGGVLNRLGVKL